MPSDTRDTPDERRMCTTCGGEGVRCAQISAQPTPQAVVSGQTPVSCSHSLEGRAGAPHTEPCCARGRLQAGGLAPRGTDTAPRLHARGQGTLTCSQGASEAFKSTCRSGRETPKTEKSDGRFPTLAAVLDGSGSVRNVSGDHVRMTERKVSLRGRSTRCPRRPGEGPAPRLMFLKHRSDGPLTRNRQDTHTCALHRTGQSLARELTGCGPAGV